MKNSTPKKILIIGNGFDLAHGLPTSYSVFLEFAKRLMYIYTCLRNVKEEEFYKDNIESWEKKGFTDIASDLLKEKLVAIFRNREAKDLRSPNKPFTYVPDVHVNKRLDLFHEYLKDNIWYNYILDLYISNQLKGENWIDFENEIAFIIKTIDNAHDSLFQLLDDIDRYRLDPAMIDKETKEKMLRFKKSCSACLHDSVGNVLNKNTVRDIRTRLYDDLEKLILAFEIYLTDIVENIPISIHIPAIETINPDHVISFNYTKTYVYIPGITDTTFDGSHTYDLSNIPTVRGFLEQTIEQINNSILELWTPAIQKAKEVLAVKRKDITEALTELNTNFEPLKQIVAKNDQLKKIDNQLKEERQRLQRATDLEKDKANHLSEADKLKKQILATRQSLLVAYEEFSQKLSELNSSGTDLVFLATIEDKRKDLFDAINGLFDNRNLKAFREDGYTVTDFETMKIDDGLFEALWKSMVNGSLGFKGGNNIQTTLEKLFSDWYYIHFNVSSGNDTINSMSPGKKALVLLELIVNLEKGQCPILIDQPEDDLDNRSIYTDLVKYLKEKKHERQIIVVTHNANVVVGADAEEVIIANQSGKEAENHSKRFEYRCGAIENVSPVFEDGKIRKGILNQKGIQEQICDILEGGKDAFEKRASKYFSTT